MEISIKKPCHENWEAMTPNQQGAFCHKCVKTVVDFSSKTLEEIKDFFTAKQEEKVCGRFEQHQLTALSFDAFFTEFKRFEFTKRVAVVVFFTFGFWLFGASNAHAQSNNRVKGDITVIEPIRGQVAVTPQPKDTTKHCTKPDTISTKIMGKVAAPLPVKPRTERKEIKKGEVIIDPEIKKAPRSRK